MSAEGQGGADLSVADARRRILADVEPVREQEDVPLASAEGRILSRDLEAPDDVPPFTNSAMDGYALRGADLPHEGERVFREIGASPAGEPFEGEVGSGECVRIMTGAPLPHGADTVVIQERVTVGDDGIRVGAGHVSGQNVRAAGEDIARGNVVLPAGRRLRPADLGMAAACGAASLPVYRRVRVAYFSTGDELRLPGEALGPGQIHDRNRYTIGAMLRLLGVEAVDLGIVADRPRAIGETMAEAARYDAVVTSGGVSVGEADHVREVLEREGEIGFWRVAVKPGRPLAVGRLGRTRFYGLPGNPVSAMVTLFLFVRPALEAMAGGQPATTLTLHLPCLDELRKRPGRAEYQRGRLVTGADGRMAVRSVGEQGSGVLGSMSRGDCFIVLPAGSEGAPQGSEVEVIPFDHVL